MKWLVTAAFVLFLIELGIAFKLKPANSEASASIQAPAK